MTAIKGGEFLIKNQEANDIFVPEDFTEEQLMMASATTHFVEVATGKRFLEILDEKLLKSLGMDDTTFQPNFKLLKRHPRYAKATLLSLASSQTGPQNSLNRERAGEDCDLLPWSV